MMISKFRGIPSVLGFNWCLLGISALVLLLCHVSLITCLTENEMAGIEALRRTFPNFTQNWPPTPEEACSAGNLNRDPLAIACKSTGDGYHVTSMRASKLPVPLPKEVEGFLWLESLEYGVDRSFACDPLVSQANLTSLTEVTDLSLLWLPNFNECILYLPYLSVTSFFVDMRPNDPTLIRLDAKREHLQKFTSDSSNPGSPTLKATHTPSVTLFSMEQHPFRRFEQVTNIYMTLSPIPLQLFPWPDLTYLKQLTYLTCKVSGMNEPIEPFLIDMTGWSEELYSIELIGDNSMILGVFHGSMRLPALTSLRIQNFMFFNGTASSDVLLSSRLLSSPLPPSKMVLLPDSMCSDWPNLKELLCTTENKKSALPRSMSSCRNLEKFSLPNSQVSGDASGLGGLEALQELKLPSSDLFGLLPSNFFQYSLRIVDLSNNRLEGPLPLGTAPLSLNLAHNHLNGSLEPYAKDFVSSDIQSISNAGIKRDSSDNTQQTSDLAKNLKNFDFVPQSVPGLDWSTTDKLDLSFNEFTGTIPVSFSEESGKRWSELDLHQNGLEGTIPTIQGFLASLDLSYNRFTALMPQGPQYLRVAHNRLENMESLFQSGLFCHLALFDASYNAFTNFSGLQNASRCGGNSVRRRWILDHNAIVASLAEVRLAQQTFGLDDMVLHHNSIYGSIDDLLGIRLSVLDLSFCHLNDSFSPQTLPTLLSGSVGQLWIEGNPEIPPLKSLNGFLKQGDPTPLILNVPSSNLEKKFSFEPLSGSNTRTSSEGTGFASHAQCFPLVPDIPSWRGHFSWDIGLFDYLQCQCIPRYYGKAPNQCFDCPGQNSPLSRSITPSLTHPPASCMTGTVVDIPSDAYANQATQPSFLEKNGPLFLETCLQDSLLSGFSNCIGSSITINQTTHFDDLQLDIITQCRIGSEGRKCAKCVCPSPSQYQSCYYSRGPICVQCARGPLSSSTVTGLVVGTIFGILIILTPIMFLVLKSSRKYDQRSWKEISLGKRLIYRSLHAIRMGYLSILLFFLQIVATATSFKQWALRTWLMLASGQLSGTGLVCLIPSLRDLMASHLLKLLLPFAICILVVLSIIFGEIIWIITQRRRKHAKNENSAKIRLLSSDSSSVDYEPLESEDSSLESRFYPWTALATSVCISILQFFYFSVALTSIEFFVPDHSQKGVTKDVYVESLPWMKMSEASRLKSASLPFLVFVVFGLPFSFFCILVKLGRQASMSNMMRLYIGSLMEKYRPGKAWWELVRLLIKLLIAVFLKAVNPLSAWRPTLVIGTLLVGAILTLVLWKFVKGIWKRDLEHLMDAISYGLLCFTFMVRLMSDREGSQGVWITAVVLDSIFIISLFSLWIFASVTEPVPRPNPNDDQHDKLDLESDSLYAEVPLTSTIDDESQSDYSSS